MPARPTPVDATVTTATSDARRTKSLLLFHSGLSAVEKIRHRYGCENSSEKSRHTWRKMRPKPRAVAHQGAMQYGHEIK
jgi:hypothetical protein